MRLHRASLVEFRLAVFRLVILGLLLSVPALADDADSSIDKWLQKAIARDSTTSGMRHATMVAAGMWDKELNKVYKKLMHRLNPEQRAALKRSQIAWLAYRDAERQTISKIMITPFGGTMYLVEADGKWYDLIKDRTLQLQEYDNILTDQGKP